MAGQYHTVLLVVVLAAAKVAAASASSFEESGTRPTILMPVADTPLGSFEGADGPVADDALEDEDAAPVGAPLGTTMTEPRPLLILTPPGFVAGDDGEDADGTSGAAAVSVLLGCSAAAVVAAAAGVFAF